MGAIPTFTPDESESIEPEVKEPVEEPEEEKETPSDPPTDEQPASEASEDTGNDVDSRVAAAVEKATLGLRGEIVKLRERLADTRDSSEKREINQQIEQAKDDIDELNDVNPEDLNTIDRILRSKGYITKREADGMFYESVKQDVITKFLDKYPEYKPENDPSDTRWTSLQREVGLYKTPTDPKFIATILERSHRAITKVSSDPTLPARRQQLKTASVGAGGVQRSSSQKRLGDEMKQQLLQGGWSNDDIKSIENNLSD